MATDSYMIFKGYDGEWLKSESTVQIDKVSDDTLGDLFREAKQGNIFEVEDYSFDVEQTLNIGSQSTGAGAGKIVFNPFSITRKIDKSSPTLFYNACQGRAFQQVSLGLRKSAGVDASGVFFLRFDFKLVAVKTISWAHDEESPKETVTFDYGGLQVRYRPQNAGGSLDPVIAQGWNRTTNTQDTTDKAIGKA